MKYSEQGRKWSQKKAEGIATNSEMGKMEQRKYNSEENKGDTIFRIIIKEHYAIKIWVQREMRRKKI